ncbi:MAG: D-alanyl-D-alanine carboxypeptidase [Clostridia bacterium]|nr:D-alanyl-D-alanine carboxypeptidase [Clostridia bacterium]
MKKTIFKTFFALCLCILCVIGTCVSTFAAEFEKPENIKACVVYNPDNQVTVYESWANVRVSPGPTAKLMTAILAAELLSSRMEDTVLVSAAMVSNVTGNTIGLKMGEHVRIRDMLYAMLLTGANDAAQVLAITACGSLDAFVAKMNARAAELGAESTKYETLTGLDLGAAKTTVTDTVTIALHAYSIPALAEIFECASYTMPATDRADARELTTRNRFATPGDSYYYDGAKSFSFGSTTPSGYCMVVLARRASLSYLCVVLGAESAADLYRAGDKLLNYAFAEYKYKTILSPLDVVAELPVKNAQSGQVTVSPATSVSVYAQIEEEVASRMTLDVHLTDETLYAPLDEGTPVGYADVYFDGACIARVDLVTAYPMAQSQWLYFWFTVRQVLMTRGTLAVLILAAVAAGMGFLLALRYRHRHIPHDDADLDAK